MSVFRAGDRVQVVNYGSDDYARRGTVARVADDGTVMVRMDFLGTVRGFLPVCLDAAPGPVNRDATRLADGVGSQNGLPRALGGQMIATFDERDAQIVASRVAALDAVDGPRVGDFVIFTDGVARRISHIWEAWEDMPASIQTSDGGSFHLGDGYVSFSGGLYPSIPADTLTLTDGQRDGSVWIFHHNRWEAHNGVDTVIPFRVYSCTLAGAR